LAQLIAYPLFAVVVYQVTEGAVTPSRSAPSGYPLLPTRAEATEQAWLTLTTIQSLSTTTDLAEALQRTTAALAQLMAADLTAIGLIGQSQDTLEFIAVHHPGAASARGVQLKLDRHPQLKRALESRRTVTVDKAAAPPEMIELYGLMGSFVVGPAIIAPLADDSQALGVVLVGNPDSGRAWSSADVEHVETVVDHIALMLTARENRQRFTQRINELEGALHRQESEASQRRSALEVLLQQAQTDAQKAATRLAALAALQEARQGSEREQVRQLQAERAQLLRQTEEYQTELSSLLQLQTALELQLKQAQQEMARLQDQLQRIGPVSAAPDIGENGQQTEVIASIVQELRTPMTSMTGYTDLLLGESVGILGAMQRQFLQRVKANIARMAGMLADLVQITAIDTGQIKLEPAPIDVPEFIKDAVMATSMLFREREQSIRLELAEHLPQLHTDGERLQQILQHLLSNASLCSPNNAEVAVRAQVPVEMPDYMLFSVSDQGGGIAPEDRLRAFHRMYRADHPLIQGVGETGVGLSIAKALVEAQGGRIWVDSEMGRGSTFTFILPLHLTPAAQQA
jgi:signal transduction histidine kinase